MKTATKLGQKPGITDLVLQRKGNLFEVKISIPEEKMDWNQTQPYWGTKRNKCGGLLPLKP